ncbi:YjaA family stress response protein [Phytobacter sp. V91]|uniref:YjaA family stress response protein n=1 Tax=Phytobacter sp. V91 TaxID=3369425 RepID=UPI003F60A3D8
MTVLYAQIYQNRMVVRNLDTRQQVSGNHIFSNQRIIIADFFEAEGFLAHLIQQVAPRSFWHLLPGVGKLRILSHALEMNEGGLSPVEERALLEMTFGASQGRCHYPKIIDDETLLNDEQVLAALAREQTRTTPPTKRPKIIS